MTAIENRNKSMISRLSQRVSEDDTLRASFTETVIRVLEAAPAERQLRIVEDLLDSDRAIDIEFVARYFHALLNQDSESGELASAGQRSAYLRILSAIGEVRRWNLLITPTITVTEERYFGLPDREEHSFVPSYISSIPGEVWDRMLGFLAGSNLYNEISETERISAVLDSLVQGIPSEALSAMIALALNTRAEMIAALSNGLK